MRIALIFIFCICLAYILQAQTDIDACFLNLKSGGILVRLQSNSLVIETLKEKNDSLKLKKILSLRDAHNREIINAFQYFAYCPVYFFYASDSKKIMQKDFDNVLLDNNLNPVKPIPDLDNNYLIAGFELSKGYSSYTDNYAVENPDLDENYKGNVTYFESGVYALVLYQPDFKYLDDKFPGSVRTFEHFPFLSRTKKEVVKILDYNIKKYVVGTYTQ
jgi:hypothetical protein